MKARGHFSGCICLGHVALQLVCRHHGWRLGFFPSPSVLSSPCSALQCWGCCFTSRVSFGMCVFTCAASPLIARATWPKGSFSPTYVSGSHAVLPPELPPLPATLPQWTECWPGMWAWGHPPERSPSCPSSHPPWSLLSSRGNFPGGCSGLLSGPPAPMQASPHSIPLPAVFLNCTSDPCTLFLKMPPTCTKTKALCGLESLRSALASLDGLHVALLPLPLLQTQATPLSLWPLPHPYPVPQAGSVQPSTSWHVLILWPWGIGALPL